MVKGCTVTLNDVWGPRSSHIRPRKIKKNQGPYSQSLPYVAVHSNMWHICWDQTYVWLMFILCESCVIFQHILNMKSKLYKHVCRIACINTHVKQMLFFFHMLHVCIHMLFMCTVFYMFFMHVHYFNKWVTFVLKNFAIICL